MNPFDECLLEADYDCIARDKREIEALIAHNVAKTKIIQADDILVISSELIDSNNKSRLPMAHDFVTRIDASSSCLPSTLCFKHLQTGVYISSQAFNALPDKRGYTRIYKHFCKGHDDYTVIGYSTNEITIQISKLSHFTASRYHNLIEGLIAMVDNGLFLHKTRKPVTNKTRYNFCRQRVLRNFKIKSYEWGLLFNPGISVVLSKYLKGIALRTVQGTYYLYESPESDCKIKIYNITAADDRPNQSSIFRPGDRLKFEITYKAAFYDKKGLQVNALTYQNDIARLLLQPNKDRLAKYLINKLPPTALVKLWSAAGVSRRSEFMALIDDNRTTQVSTDERINELQARMNALETLTQAIQERQDAINAHFQAQLDEIKDAVLVQSTIPDKRKTRNAPEFKNNH